MKKPLRIIYFGTPFFAAEILAYLFDQEVSIAAVVTQPDRPQGRSLQLSFSAVKKCLLEKRPEIPLLQPEKASAQPFLDSLHSFKADLYVVVAYGQILSQKLLDLPPLGCINIHASLLPKYRGAAPIQRCLLEGETQTGVAIQKMVKQLDAGDVIQVATLPIPLTLTYGELQTQLCQIAKPLLLSVLRSYESGIPPAKPQDPALVTYAAKVEVEEAEIRWDLPAEKLHNRVRAFSPKPGAWCWVWIGEEKKRLKIFRTLPLSHGGDQPGTFLSKEGAVACQEGALQLLEVQPEGKKAMPFADWVRGLSQKALRFSS